jgi:hypothetical protein
MELITSTVGAVMADAVSDLTALGEEYREWYDNLPEGLQGSRDDIDEAASTLENLSEPGCPQIVSDLPVKYTPLVKKKPSRAVRGNQAVYELQCVVSALEEWLEKNENENVSSFRDEIQQVIDDTEGMEYPGMFR